tara:strand:+ start:347 stop:694 length:348 start_codon:yes stop_codon:yes gene_type:complete
MNNFNLLESIKSLNSFDPSPFFVISLIPYLLFLYWLKDVRQIPKISFWGFSCTLLFVLITILCAIIAKIYFNAELTDVDFLHGTAESFLTISDGLIVIGLLRAIGQQKTKEVNNF